jgi:hypothetical protein
MRHGPDAVIAQDERMRPATRIALALFLPPAAFAGAGDAVAADSARGRALYELHCDGCHAESVHGRKKRVATDFESVRAWVGRWNTTLKLKWSAEEVDDVAQHLNATYYRYPCPATVCKVVSGSPRPLPLIQIKGSRGLAPYLVRQ